MNKIYAPFTYWEASDEDKLEVCNGCGAKNGIKVPDSLLFCNIQEACNVHDWMYSEGKTLGDFYFANAVFIMNMALIITAGSKWLVALRLLFAGKYFLAVQEFGSKAYWVDKQENHELHITYKGCFK